MVIKGACLSRIDRRVESWLSSSSGSDVGGCRIRSDEVISLLNSMIIMPFLQRKINSEGGGGGVGVWV